MHVHKFQSFLCVAAALAMLDVLSAGVTAAEGYKSSAEWSLVEDNKTAPRENK